MEAEKRIKELESRILELEKQVKDNSTLVVTRKEHERILAELTKATKLAEEANKSKTMFLANMSHEIRTPMNSIIGIYNVLSQTDLTDEQKEFLEIINISSHNLLAIINDILDLSKIEAGQLRLEFKSFFLHEEIHQIIKLLSLKAKGKGVELYSKVQSTVPTCVIGDPVRIKQILINLTNNALKFTNEGHVVLSVETIDIGDEDFPSKKEFVPDDYLAAGIFPPDMVILKFDVSDTGIGISPEEQEDLFTDFAQLENPLIQKYEGTGLGLSISRNLTNLMNGKIGVISEKCKGSTFWFTLVMEKGDEGLLFQHRSGIVSVPKKSRPLTILLVEDNLLNQKFAMTSLQRVGHKVDLAENGKTAVERFRNTAYDLILMDIAMPIMDGIEATQVIRKLEKEMQKEGTKPADHNVKIVAVTAHVMITDRDKCLSAGMDEYIAKPYRPQELITIIDNLGIY
jgi:signal transduction histidine kinase/ActR/RegA family two-component response regulator